MKESSHLHLDVTVPFVWSPSQNVLEAPKFIREFVYPKSAEGNPIATFLENVNAPSNIRINIHIEVLPT